MTRAELADDWWPEWLQDLASDDPMAEDPVLVAGIEATAVEYERYRHLFTALVSLEQVEAVLRRPGGIGHDIRASGPHPGDDRGRWNYSPRFWIDTDRTSPDKLEPLVVSWESANRRVLWPDQGFLMTYGLVPRFVQETGGGLEMHWDDPSVPRADVVVARLVSTYSFPSHTGARVAVAREYLQDYATIRSKGLVQVYYLERSGPLCPEVEALLGDQQQARFLLPGRLLDLRFTDHGAKRGLPVLAQVWGVRLLLRPGEAPVSAGREEFGSLAWPGIPEAITEETARRLGFLERAYVRDDVLGLYEGQPEFSVHPEYGSVSYEHQWSVSPTWRIGRDLIAVDLKKLYEGNQSDTVRHWHEHAVNPPADPQVLRHTPNVGTRARRIVYALADLGEALADIATAVLGRPLTSEDIVGVDRADLDYRGWWTAEHVEPIARHIPLGLTTDDFLGRCDSLNKLVVEALKERPIRKSLIALGVPEDDLSGLKSLKLLDKLVQLTDLASKTGLRLTKDGSLLNTRAAEDPQSTPIACLFALSDLRQVADHHIGTRERQRRLTSALALFGLDLAGYAAGWGLALDAIYDRIGEALEQAAGSLSRSLTG